jgi:hypothetical protein
MLTQTRAIDEDSRAVGNRSDALDPGQLAKVIVLGVVFWFAAAMTVRFGSAAGFFGPSTSMIAFAVTIPVCWLSVLLIKKIARLNVGQTLPGIVLGTVAATCCDGIALTWGRGLYGSDSTLIIFGAAWILWGAGLFLLFAYLDDHRQSRAPRPR